jgi:hypothetical protein
MTSSSIARTSRAASTEPAGCGTEGSRNIRTTCSRASALRNGATSSSACAPALAAARAGDIREFHGGRHALARIERAPSFHRGGRRALEPHRRSRPPCRHARVASLMLVSSWKSDVLPEEGKPIRPARNIGKIESTAPRAPAPAGHASAALPGLAEPGIRPLHYGPLRLPNLPRMAHPCDSTWDPGGFAIWRKLGVTAIGC